MIVVDASACVDLVLANARGHGVADLLRGQRLHAPDLLDLEVTSALARLEHSGNRPADVMDAALAEFVQLPVRRHRSRALLGAAWSLRKGLRVSDACYVALARRLGAPLLTTDGRLARGRPADIEVLVIS